MHKKNFDEAIEKLKVNKDKAPGIDGLTMYDVLEDTDKWYSKTINRIYNFQPDIVRRVEIPKSDGGTRPLGIPNIGDKIIQMMFKKILEPIIEPKFHSNSFGFRPKRSTEHAIAYNSILINRGKLYYCVDVDIKGFFDNIDHNKLIKQLWSLGIQDRSVIKIIKLMLKAKIKTPTGDKVIPIKGTPQGGILSPLLANVVLNELDWWIHNQWVGIKTNKKYTYEASRIRDLKNTTNLREVRFVRYADDFKLLCRTRKAAEIYFKLVKQFLKKRLKLDISERKSKVINLRRSSSNFLGFRIKAKPKGKAKNKRKYYAGLHLSDKTQQRICRNLKKQIKKIKSSGKHPLQEASKFNLIIRGVHNYYRIATHCVIDFNKIAFKVSHCMYNYLGPPNYYQDERCKGFYPGYQGKHWTISGVTLFPIHGCRTKNPKQFSIKEKEIRSRNMLLSDAEKLLQQSTIANDHKWAKARAEVHFHKKGKCFVSGEYLSFGKFDVHHKIPKQFGGTDDLNNLILLKPEIHKELHKTNSAESLMLNKRFKKLKSILDSCKNN